MLSLAAAAADQAQIAGPREPEELQDIIVTATKQATSGPWGRALFGNVIRAQGRTDAISAAASYPLGKCQS